MTARSMQEPTFLIRTALMALTALAALAALTALTAGPQQGYGIITDVLRISVERVRLRAGTLYAALDRLEREGLVEAGQEEVVDSRARRGYRLTSEGESRLAEEVERLRRTAETAASWLRARHPRPALSAALRGGVV